MKHPRARHLIALAASAALFTGCGGDGADGTADAPLRAGDEYTALVLINDQVAQAETRKVFGVTASGGLTDDPDAAHLDGALVTLTTEADASGAPLPAVADPAALQRFLAELWPALQARYGTAQPAGIWAELDDQDQGLAEVHADYLRSGLSLADWVDFYAATDAFQLPSAHEGQQERELAQWLAAAQLSHADLLRELAAQGLDWPGFLGTLQARGQGFDDLRQRWVQQAPSGIAAFIADFLHPATPAVAAREQAKLLADHWVRHASGFWLRNPNIAEHWRRNSPPEWRSALRPEVNDDENLHPGRNGHYGDTRKVTMLLCKEKRSKIGAWFFRNDCAKVLSQTSFELDVSYFNGIIDRVVLKQTEHFNSWGTTTSWATLDKVEGPTKPGYNRAYMEVSVGVNGVTDTGAKHADQHTFKLSGVTGLSD